MLKPAFQAACREAVEELARETAQGGPAMVVGTPWVEHGLLYNAVAAAPRRADRSVALQGRSAELRRVRREARLCAGANAGAGQFPRRAHRHSDLRGHLGPGARGMHRRDRRRNPAGAEWLALPARRGRPTAVGRGRAREGYRTAADLSQPDRRTGRTCVRGRVVRSQRRRLARRPASGLRRGDRDHALDAQVRRLALRTGRDRAARSAGQVGLHRLHAGPARLCRQERLSRRGARIVGRHRFRAGARRSASMRSDPIACAR